MSPDITKCDNQSCPSIRSCYRYMMKPDPIHQSYGFFKPKKKTAKKCEYFMKLPPVIKKKYTYK